MRLIDADRLLQGYEDHDFIDTHVVWNAPTVDAEPVEDHKIIVEKARREAYHSGYKQGRFDEFIEAQYGRGDYDIVPVCRCKDCKYAKCIEQNDDWWECSHDKRVMHGDGFCSWAERKEE